jgi:hypothetical protein
MDKLKYSGTYVTLLLVAGFELTHLVDWAPSAEKLLKFPEWSQHCERPMFLLIGARKKEV